MKMIFLRARVLLLFLLIFNSHISLAANTYFVYTKFKSVNLRVGPGKTYPINWVIEYNGEPLEVYNKVENWLRCVDFNGDEGWVHVSNISKRNPNIVVRSAKKQYVTLFAREDEKSRRLFRVENGRRIKLKKCNETWCKVSVNNQDAWVLKIFTWGSN